MEDSAMANEFDDRNAVHVHRDHEGVARDLLHTDEPYITRAQSAQLAGILEINLGSIVHLASALLPPH
jgi:hypothetical protein